MAYERVTLYGMPVVAQRKVDLRPHRRRCCPASCSCGTRWSRATGTPTTRSSPQNRALLDDVEELEHRARRRDIVVDDETLSTTSTTSASRPTSCAAGTSTPGGSGRGSETPDLLTFTMADLVSGEAAGAVGARLPGRVGAGRPAAAADLPVRAGLGRRRRDRARPGRRAEPGLAGRLRLAGARAAPGARHRADQVAAQAAAGALRAGAGHARAHVLAVVEPRSRPLLDALETELLERQAGRRAAPRTGSCRRCPTTCA